MQNSNNEQLEHFLAIETTGAIMSIAVAKRQDDKTVLLAEKNIYVKNSHDKLLAVSVIELLRDLDMSIQDLCSVFVSNGPGAFTGLRIGLSFAKGLIQTGKINLLLFNTLKAKHYSLRSSVGLAEVKLQQCETAIIRHSHSDKYYLHTEVDTIGGSTILINQSEILANTESINTIFSEKKIDKIDSTLIEIIASDMFKAYNNGYRGDKVTKAKSVVPYYKQEFTPTQKKAKITH